MILFEHGDIIFGGARVNGLVGGSGFSILLLHGSGPRASTAGMARLPTEPLAERYRAAATCSIRSQCYIFEVGGN
jgi:hypothetical protein